MRKIGRSLLSVLLSAGLALTGIPAALTVPALADSQVTEMNIDGQTVYVPEDGVLALPQDGGEDEQNAGMGALDGEMTSDASDTSDGGEMPETDETEDETGAGSLNLDMDGTSMGSTGLDTVSETEIPAEDDGTADLGSGSGNAPDSESEDGSTSDSTSEMELAPPAENDQQEEGDETSVPTYVEAGSTDMGAGEVSVDASIDGYLSVGTGKSVRKMVTVTNVSGNMYLQYVILKGHCSARWDDQFSAGATIGLTISGVSAGQDFLTIMVKRRWTNRILASVSYAVTVTDAANQLSISSSEISLESGQETTVSAKAGNLSEQMVIQAEWQSGTRSCCALEWAGGASQSGDVYTIPMRIRALRAGHAVYALVLRKKSDQSTVRYVFFSVTVTERPSMSASPSSVSLEAGSSTKVRIAGYGYSSLYCFYAHSDSSCVKIDFQRTADLLTVTGRYGGTANILVEMKAWETGKVLASIRVTARVTSRTPSLKASKYTVNLDSGSSEWVTVTAVDFREGAVLNWRKQGTSAEASYGTVSGGSVPVKFTGTSQGTTVFTYLLQDSGGAVLASMRITVNVAAKASLTCSAPTVRIQQGQSADITFTAVNVSETFRLNARGRFQAFSHQWGCWNGSSITAHLTGQKAGDETYTVILERTRDHAALAAVQVRVVVTALNPTLAVYPPGVAMDVNESRDISILYSNPPANALLVAVCKRRNVVDPAWVGKSGRLLRLQAKGAGTTTVTVAMVSQDRSTTYASASIQVTVRSTSRWSEGDLAFSFGNHWDFFGYSRPYHVPLESYQLVYGRTTTAQNFFNSDGDWGGSCYGMSLTSALMATHSDLSVSEFNSSASATSGLQPRDFSSRLGVNLTRLIEALQVVQYASSVDALEEDVHSNLKALADEVKNGRLAVVCYGAWVRRNDGSWGPGYHAVLAYSLVKGSGADYVYVCDPNYPGDSSRRITLYKNSAGQYTSWLFDINGHYPTGTGYRVDSISIIHMSDVARIWSSRGRITDASLNMLSTNTDNFRVYDVEDKIVAEVRNRQLVSSADGVRDLKIADEPSGSEYKLYLPVRLYRVEDLDDPDGMFRASMTNVELGARVATEGREITFAVEDSNDLSQVNITPEEGAAYQVELQSSREGDPQSTKVSGVGTGSDISMQLSRSEESGSAEFSQSGLGAAVVTQDGVTSAVDENGNMTGSHDIRVTAGDGGTVFPEADDSGVVTVGDGFDQTFRFTPKTGYYVQDVKVDGVSIGAPAKYRFRSVKEDHTIEVTFGHDHVSDEGTVTRKADCGNEGEKIYHCRICGEVLRTEVLSKTEHIWEQWRTVSEPTAVQSGVKERVCSVCGSVQSQEVPRLQAYVKLNVSGTLPMKTRQKTSAVTASLQSGDYLVSVTPGKTSVVKARISGDHIMLTAGRKKGKTPVTVRTAAGASAVLNVKVQTSKVKASKITALPRNLQLKVKQTYTLQPAVAPVTATDRIMYRSSNKKVAAVSRSGKIRAKKSGKTVITVTCGKKKVKLTVHVSR